MAIGRVGRWAAGAVWAACLVAAPGLAACDDAPAGGDAPTPDAEVHDAIDARAVVDSDDDAVSTVDATIDVAQDTTAPVTPLGLNDVTMLLPPPDGHAPLVDVTSLVAKALFESLVTASGDVFTDYARLRLVAVRFDLCDRITPGPCATDADGRVRLVLQPYFAADGSQPFFEDVAVHAFYPIPNADLPAVVARLRELAALQGYPPDAPLVVSPALSADIAGEYAAKLRALILDYAAPERIDRLTAFAQFSTHAALNWLFRGREKGGGDALAPIAIPEVAVPQQEVLLLGELSYQITPLGVKPDGFATIVEVDAFEAADATGKRRALEALAAADNPLAHTPDTVQCVACHVATSLMADRAPRAAIDPLTLAGRFSAPGLDLRPLGDFDHFSRSLRALGYIGDGAVASQRAVNESAEVLAEIAARFGSAR